MSLDTGFDRAAPRRRRLTLREAARRMGVSVATVRRRVKKIHHLQRDLAEARARLECLADENRRLEAEVRRLRG